MKLLKALVLTALFVGAHGAIASRHMGVPVRPLSGEERVNLAQQSVVMLYDDSSDDLVHHAIGAATLVGLDDRCLYAATANHVVRPPAAAARPRVWVRTKYVDGAALEAVVLSPRDADLDLAALCIPLANKYFVPLPRFPFFVLGVPSTLAAGDPLVFYGNGSETAWHRAGQPMRYEATIDAKLRVRGDGVAPGDSGGGLFVREAVFDELVGMIIQAGEGMASAVSIEVVVDRFKKWNLPVSLHSWNSHLAYQFETSLFRAASRYLAYTAPPEQSPALDRLKRLVVRIVDSNTDRLTGLLLATDESSAYVAVPAKAAGLLKSASSVTLVFSSGFTRTGKFVDGIADSGFAVLSVPMTGPDRFGLGLEFASFPGASDSGQEDPMSPLRVPLVPSGDIVAGMKAYLAGVDADTGAWRVVPPDFIVAQTLPELVLMGTSVNRQSEGWLALDDRNRILGLVTASTDDGVSVRSIEELMSSAPIAATPRRLRPWQPTHMPIDVLSAGAQRPGVQGCPYPALVSYGQSEEAASLVGMGSKAVVGAFTRMEHWTQTESYTAIMPADGASPGMQRFQVPGQKGAQHLLLSRDGHHLIQTMQVSVADGARPTPESPQWCTYLRASALGAPREAANLCGARQSVLVRAAAHSGSDLVVSGSLEERGAIRAAALASVNSSGHLKLLASDPESTVFTTIGVSKSGDMLVAGSTIASGATSHSVVISKYSPSGVRLWRYLDVDAERSQQATSLLMLEDGSLLVAGWAVKRSAYVGSARLWRLAPNGALLWSRDYGEANRAVALDVISDGTGGAIVAGQVEWPDGSSRVADGWLFAIDANGQVKWQRTYSQKYALRGRSLRLTRIARGDSGYWVLGDMSVPYFAGRALLVLMVDQTGETVSAGCQAP